MLHLSGRRTRSREMQVLEPYALLLTHDYNETYVLLSRNEGCDEQNCFNEAG